MLSAKSEKFSYKPMIKKSLKNRMEETSPVVFKPHWNAKFLGLDKIPYFNDLSIEKQQEVLLKCSQSIIEEAMHVEVRGIDFASKIILASESMEEKLNYSLIHADEVEHYFGVKKYLHFEEKNESEHVFINLIKEIIDSSDEYLMVFFIQVVLEGWGMSHYKDIGQECLNPELQTLLKRIQVDEARHHASGLVHYLSRGKASDRQVKIMKELLVRFMQMIRIGPQTVVGHLEKTAGGFSKEQRIKAFTHINPVVETSKKLQNLKRLLNHDLNGTLVDQLDQQDMFRAMTPEECAEVCLS